LLAQLGPENRTLLGDGMARAYSGDLRVRVIRAVEGGLCAEIGPSWRWMSSAPERDLRCEIVDCAAPKFPFW